MQRRKTSSRRTGLRTLNYERAIVPWLKSYIANLRLRTLNYERAIVPKALHYEEVESLRTLNYERAIVPATRLLKLYLCLRTLNYERAIVQPTRAYRGIAMSQNPQLREGYCAYRIQHLVSFVKSNTKNRFICL